MKLRSLFKLVVFWSLILILSCASGPKVKEIAALHYGDDEAEVVEILGEGSQSLLFKLDGVNYSYRYYTTTITDHEYALLFADSRLYAVSKEKPPFGECITEIAWDECFRLAKSHMQSERLVTGEGDFAEALSEEEKKQKARTGAAVVGTPVLIVAWPIVLGVGAMCVTQEAITTDWSPKDDMERSRQKSECKTIFYEIEKRLDGINPNSGLKHAVNVINDISSEYLLKIVAERYYDTSDDERRIYGRHWTCGDYPVRRNLIILFGGKDDVIIWKSKNIDPAAIQNIIGLPPLPPTVENLPPDALYKEHAETLLQMYWDYPQHKEAKKWLCRSADSGNSEAQYRLGLLYENGSEGVPEDMARAFMWYRFSAASGDYSRATDNALRVRQMLTEDQAAKAEMLIHKWLPGQCERNLTEGIINEKMNDSV